MCGVGCGCVCVLGCVCRCGGVCVCGCVGVCGVCVCVYVYMFTPPRVILAFVMSRYPRFLHMTVIMS